MKRIRYDNTHWAVENDECKALEQYLRLGARPYNKTKERILREMAGNLSGKKVLDYGGGAGILSIPFLKEGAKVTIVDAEANALRTAEFYAAAEEIPYKLETIHSETFPARLKKEQYDIIVAKDIIEHVQEDQVFLENLADCQQAGGILLLSTQSSLSLNYVLEGGYQKYWRRNKNWCGWDQTHVRFYNPFSLKEKLLKAGYRPQKWAGVFIIPYNILSYLFLLKIDINLSWLHNFDLYCGRIFPFNRFGWNILVKATKLS